MNSVVGSYSLQSDTRALWPAMMMMMMVVTSVTYWLCPGESDNVLRVVLACHKHSKSLSRTDVYSVSLSETILQRALCHSDDQVVIDTMPVPLWRKLPEQLSLLSICYWFIVCEEDFLNSLDRFLCIHRRTSLLFYWQTQPGHPFWGRCSECW